MNPTERAQIHFSQSRVKEIVEAAQARLNAGNTGPRKMSLEAKFLSIIGFQEMLFHNAPEQLLEAFQSMIVTLSGDDILDNFALFRRIADAFKADIDECAPR